MDDSATGRSAAMGGNRAVRSLAAEAAIEDDHKEWAAAEAPRKAAGPANRTLKKVAKKTSAAKKTDAPSTPLVPFGTTGSLLPSQIASGVTSRSDRRYLEGDVLIVQT